MNPIFYFPVGAFLVLLISFAIVNITDLIEDPQSTAFPAIGHCSHCHKRVYVWQRSTKKEYTTVLVNRDTQEARRIVWDQELFHKSCASNPTPNPSQETQS